MYQFSRSLYRELAQDVVSGRGEDVVVTRQRFLRACETSMERLALDRHYFAKPVRTLFRDGGARFVAHRTSNSVGAGARAAACTFS